MRSFLVLVLNFFSAIVVFIPYYLIKYSILCFIAVNTFVVQFSRCILNMGVLLLRRTGGHKSFSEELVGTSGLEPPTSRLSGARSNHLSYAPMYGGDEEVRTPDPLRARQVLSQLSYTPKFRGQIVPSKSNNIIACQQALADQS